MTHGVTQPALLSKTQLDAFRTQLARKHDAMFLAPQLLEQLAILTRHMKVALGLLESARGAVADLERELSERAAANGRCAVCEDQALRSALQQLRAILGQD